MEKVTVSYNTRKKFRSAGTDSEKLSVSENAQNIE